jgi:hypothetical protein
MTNSRDGEASRAAPVHLVPLDPDEKRRDAEELAQEQRIEEVAQRAAAILRVGHVSGHILQYAADDGRVLDVARLEARGWTEALIQRFLGPPDCKLHVNHYRNFTGKRAWKLKRIETAEKTLAFLNAFALSIAKRRLAAPVVRRFLKERARRFVVTRDDRD